MVKITFFPIDLSYETRESGRATIKIFGKTNDGKRVCVFDRNFEPYFWVIAENFNEIKDKLEEFDEVVRVDFHDRKYLGRNVKALKVIVNGPADVVSLRQEVKDIDGVESVNEADINFVKRYLIDKKIIPLVSCTVEGEIIQKKDYDVDFCINSKKIVAESEAYDSPKILGFDIETYTVPHRYPDSRVDPIIALSFYGKNFKKMITWKKILTDRDITFVDGEAGLIREFKKVIQEYKPDYLVGYFSDGFDFPYIYERAKRHNIVLNIGLDKSNVKVSRRGIGSSKIEGIVHIDILSFIKRIIGVSLRVDNFRLGTVAKFLLNKEKDDLDINKIGVVWDSGSNEVEKICEYNLQDALLAYELCENLLPNLNEITKIVGQPLFDVCRMSYGRLVEWYLIKRAFEFNEICPNRPEHSEIVERRMNGLYENIAILDFKGFYPTIIVAHNIDPGTLTENKEDSYETPEIISEEKKTKYYFSYKEEGFIPKVVKDLILRRNRVKEIIKKEGTKPILEARSYGLKTISNSLYGYFGYFGARWYSKECASSITAFSREYIKDVVEKAQKEFEVIYGDTDSIFIGLKDKTKEDALGFLEEINRELPGIRRILS